MKLLNKGILYLSTGIAFMAISCANEAPWDSTDRADGKIVLNLTADGSVSEGTRAEGTSAYVPSPSEFSINMKSTDGSYSNSWNSLDGFNKEAGFPMGSYKIAASYGENNQEGFKNPYFYGESTVNVLLGESSTVNITAILANSMVTIKYDDNFSEFFPAHSASVQTDGHDPVVFAQTESRPAYVTSGTMNLKLTLTNENNNTITVSPASFVAEPRKHYIVTFGVDGNTDRGYGALTVEWSEELVNETKEILLTEEMFAAPAPEVVLKGSDSELSLVEGLDYESVNPEFHIFAYGGMKNVELHISADDANKLPACGANVKLIGDSSISKSEAESSGIDCSGIFDKIGDMAVVNLKNMIKNLAPGEYTVSIDVEDSLERTATSETILKVKVTGLEYKFVTYEKPKYLANEIIIIVAASHELVANQLQFQSVNSAGTMVGVTGELLPDYNFEAIATDLDYKFAYKLTVPVIEDYKWKVAAAIPGKTTHELSIDVEMPEFKMECDAFAKRVRIRPVSSTAEELKAHLLEKGVLYKGNQAVTNYTIEDGMIILKDLTPAQTYSDYSLSLGSGLYDGYKNNITFTTEAATDVPNGDFNTEICPQNMTERGAIQVGGQWKVGAFDYTIKSSINRNVASDWMTLNPKTCNPNAVNKNSWYIVPSTYVEVIDGINTNIIRSVGYHDNGPTIGKSGQFLTTIYYCTNTPSELKRSVGELFLGNYSYNNTEQRTNGITFKSRPSKISFDYSYTPIENESAEFIISILGSENKVLYTDTKKLGFTESSTLEIEFPEYQFGEKAETLYISFKSSTNTTNPAIHIPTGEELYEGRISLPVTPYIVYKNANDYNAVATGSELRISNVHLGYE